MAIKKRTYTIAEEAARLRIRNRAKSALSKMADIDHLIAIMQYNAPEDSREEALVDQIRFNANLIKADLQSLTKLKIRDK